MKKYSDYQIEPLNIGEIAFVLSDVPNGRALARTFLILKNDKYTLNQRIAGLTPTKGINSVFLSELMNRNRYFLKFDSGVSQTNLSRKEMMDFCEYYPDNAEQTKIGHILYLLQDAIAANEDHLKLSIKIECNLEDQLIITS